MLLLSLLGFFTLASLYWSMGQLVQQLSPKIKVDQAESFALGSFLFVVIQFLAQIFTAWSFAVTAQILGAIFFSVLVYQAIVKRKTLNFGKVVSSNKVIFLSLGVWLLAAVVLNNLNYEPKFWDEFSHWLLMPKQIMLFDQAEMGQLPYTQFAHYPPGVAISALWWPAFLGLDFHPAWVLMFYQTLFFVFLINLINSIKKLFFIETHKSFPVGLLIGLSLYTPLLFHLSFPTNALIEPLQCIVLGTALLFVLNRARKFEQTEWLTFSLFAALSLVAAYLFKPATLILGVIYILGFYLIKKHNTDLNRKSYGFLLAALVPVGLIFYIWTVQIAEIPKIGLILDGEIHPSQSLVEKLGSLASNWLQILKAVLIKLSSLKGVFLIFPLLIILRKYLAKNSLKLALAFFVIYSVLLSVTYATSFVPLEGLKLAHFDRYMVLPMFLLRLILLMGLVNYISQKINIHFLQNNVSAVLISLFVLSGVLFCFQVHISSQHKDRDYNEIYKIISKFNQAVDFGLKSPKVSFILNDSNCESFYIAKYTSLGKEKLFYQVLNQSVVADDSVNFCTIKRDESSINKWLDELDYALIIRSDEKFQNLLETVVPSCQGLKWPYYIKKESELNKVECHSI